MQIAKVRRSDGRVVAFSNLSDKTAVQALSDAAFECVAISPPVDTARIYDWNGDALVEVVPAPQSRDLLEARFSEFMRLDALVTGERTLSAEWAAYRQALRDLTEDGDTFAAMLARFPLRPDGTDAIAWLRN
jgi:hypothetical protein